MSRARFFLLLLTPPVFLLVIVSAASGQTKAVEHFIYLPAIFHPLPNVENISPPLLIDGEAGLLYASAAIDGVEQTVVLATHDGSFVDTFPYAGRLALDRNHHWLMIDQGDAGVVFLDSFSGQLLGIQDLPDPGPLLANPQMDPDSGRAYAFRGHDVYTIDVQLQELVDAQTLFVPYESCGVPQGPATIYDSYYDLISDTFFLSFLTYTCTPHYTFTFHTYDPASWHDWSEQSAANYYQAVPFAGSLYGMSFSSIVGTHGYWALSRSGTWYSEVGGGDLVDLDGSVVDWSRQLLYEAFKGYLSGPGGEVVKKFRISNTADRQNLGVVEHDQPPILDALLAGHDPHTDMLYFLDGGELLLFPTTSVLPVGPQPAGWEANNSRPGAKPTTQISPYHAPLQSP